MSEKQIGYSLLAVGITIMSIALIIAIMLFTGYLKPFPLFNIPAPSINTGSMIPSIPGLPAAKGENIEILPTKAFNDLLNLGIQFLLMTFIMSFGFKLADLGIKLLRPIKIEAKP